MREEDVDRYVTELLLGRLEELTAAGFASGESSGELVAARHEAADLQRYLDETAEQVGRGRMTADMAGGIEASILPKLNAARQQIRDLSVPAALHPFTDSEDIAATWEELSIAAKRPVIREITAQISVGAPTIYRTPVADRVTVTWKGEPSADGS